jgi:hypothetical protein
MKAIRINAPLRLNCGIEIPSGAIVVLNKAQVFQQKGNIVPVQISASTFVSVDEWRAGKSPIDASAIEGYNPANVILKMDEQEYWTRIAGDYFMHLLFFYTDTIYPGQCEIVSLWGLGEFSEQELRPNVPAVMEQASKEETEGAPAELPTWSRFIKWFNHRIK